MRSQISYVRALSEILISSGYLFDDSFIQEGVQHLSNFYHGCRVLKASMERVLKIYRHENRNALSL